LRTFWVKVLATCSVLVSAGISCWPRASWKPIVANLASRWAAMRSLIDLTLLPPKVTPYLSARASCSFMPLEPSFMSGTIVCQPRPKSFWAIAARSVPPLSLPRPSAALPSTASKLLCLSSSWVMPSFLKASA
jgi:hypothetical protein